MTRSSSEEPFRKALPKALVLLRKSRGFLQEELAERSGIQQPVLWRYETGASTPTSARLSRVLHALVASWSDLDLALAEVQRAEEHGEVPSEEVILDRPATTKGDLTIAFMKANQEGRLVEQTRFLGRLQSRMNVKKVFEEDETGASETTDEAKRHAKPRSAHGSEGDEDDEG